MTAISTPIPSLRAGSIGAWRGAALLAVALAAVVAARWSATRLGLDSVAVGGAFGVGLFLIALIAPGDPPKTGEHHLADVARRAVPAIAIGSAVGLAFVATSVVGPALAGVERVPGLGRPAAPFVPWALVNVLVASAEEAVLRGVLFDRVAHAGGAALALAVTTCAFALLHVPLYGWQVVPLDLAVGLCLGGLRMATRSVAAPAAAHIVADLATWWL
jgi:membrane protease YdiL (CAAX protease family)